MKHYLSTIAWGVVLVLGIGFYAGVWFGNYTSPARHDLRMVEQRLREVVCEVAVKNNLIPTCKVD